MSREGFSRTINEAYAKGLVCQMHANAGWTACDCNIKQGLQPLDPPEPIGTVGHNNPPSQAQFAAETAMTIGEWLKTHPVIQTEDEAKEYKLLRDRGKCCLADMEDERKLRLEPLRKQVNAVNDEYVGPRVLLDKVLGTGDDRINAWIKQEEERRRKIKEDAWKKVQEAENAALEAAEREQDAKEAASVGVEADILAASRDTDGTARALERARREALRAERSEGVRVTGGHRRALSIRKHVNFIITDPALVVQELGWTKRLYEALEIEVRDHFRAIGVYPKGIQIKSERKVQ